MAQIYAGGTPSKDEIGYWVDGTVPWLNSGSVNDWSITQPSTHITSEALRRSSARWIPAGSVVIALAGQGRTKGMAARLEIDSTCNQSMAALVPGPDLDYRYLQYWLTSNYESIRNLSGGDSRDGLNLQHVGDIECPLPPLDEQRRIADYLDNETTHLDRLGALRARQRALLSSELAALLESEIARPFDEMRVPLMHLTDPRRPIQYGIVLPGPDWPGGVPIIKGGDIGARRLSPTELKRTDPAIERRYARSRVRGGDYVIAIRGSVGELARVPPSLEGANLTQDSARIAPYDCDAVWLGAVLQTPDLQNQMRQQTTGATIKGINISELRRLRVPTPTRSEQHVLGQRAAEHSRRFDAADAALGSSVALMRARRQALVTAAVTGQLDVTTAREGHP